MRHVATLAALCCGAIAAPAAADEVERSAAQALFEAARQLMQAGRFHEACPKLAESQKLEPAAGTLLNLAVCHEQEGRIATAWVDYNDTLSLTVKEGDTERESIARDRIRAIEGRLSRLVIEPPVNAPPGTAIAIDGMRLGSALLNTPMPVDPGEHQVSATAPGWIPVTVRVHVDDAHSLVEVRLPHFEQAPVPKTAVLAAPLPPPDSGGLRWAVTGSAFALAAAGLVFTGYWGWQAKDAWEQRNQICRQRCNERAVEHADDARRFALGADVGFAVAVVSLGVGTYFLLSTPGTKGRHLSVGIGPERGGGLLHAGGAF